MTPSQLMDGADQIPSIKVREQMIAHNVLKTTMANYNEQSFVAFVGKEKLYTVAHEMIKFLNDGDSFLKYKQPPTLLDEVDKEDAMQSLKLMSKIYEEPAYIPFKHHESDRLILNNVFE